MSTIIEKAKAEFIEMVNDFGADPFGLRSHVPEAEKWVRLMIGKYPEADEEIILLAVWMHDLGHYPIPTEVDHAVRSEERAREFLKKENYPENRMGKVLHCVRAHRCGDVMPQSLEAKILAFADSASHMTDTMYLDIAREDKNSGRDTSRAYFKMERDWRDLAAFPEVRDELTELHNAWEVLLRAYEKSDI